MTASQVKPVFLAVEKFIRKVISSQIPPCKEVTAEYYQTVGSLSQGVGEQFASHMQLRISCHKRLYSGFSRNCQSVSQQLAELRSSTESNILNCNVSFVKIGNANVICLANIQENHQPVQLMTELHSTYLRITITFHMKFISFSFQRKRG